jgi:hypothetical protein
VDYIGPRSRKHSSHFVTEDEIAKFPLNMSAIRRNMFSEHRSRMSVKVRDDIRSSGNSRINIPSHSIKSSEPLHNGKI